MYYTFDKATHIWSNLKVIFDMYIDEQKKCPKMFGQKDTLGAKELLGKSKEAHANALSTSYYALWTHPYLSFKARIG